MVNTRNCGSQWDDPRDAKGFSLRHRGCRDQIITMKRKVTLLVTIALLSWFLQITEDSFGAPS